jgi:flagellar biosynthesis/type III secretory pathway chaperone
MMDKQTETLYKNLVDCLEDELKVYRHLLDIVRKEKDILISAKIDDLNENNKSKELMLAKLRQLERLREKSSRELAIHLGANVERPRLMELAAKMTGEEAKRLQSLHQTFDIIVQRVKELNLANESLAGAALANIQGAMQALRTTLGETPTYKKQGDMKSPEVLSGQLVSREA